MSANALCGPGDSLHGKACPQRGPERSRRAGSGGIAQRQTALYRRDKDAAVKLVSVGDSKPNPKLDVGELAAWTTVTSTILNLDETITKE